MLQIYEIIRDQKLLLSKNYDYEDMPGYLVSGSELPYRCIPSLSAVNNISSTSRNVLLVILIKLQSVDFSEIERNAYYEHLMLAQSVELTYRTFPKISRVNLNSSITELCSKGYITHLEQRVYFVNPFLYHRLPKRVVWWLNNGLRRMRF